MTHRYTPINHKAGIKFKMPKMCMKCIVFENLLSTKITICLLKPPNQSD
ncbi:hypothetical protein AO372_1861 [Moraxella catarrhalis]|nr:hypothetical protein AO372_1861 [Moraxella catarrhalis]